MDQDPKERRVSAGLAALAGILGPGLGYLYVGRLLFAVATLLAIFAIAAIAGWTRLILEPTGFYVVLGLILLVFLVSIVHAALIAHRAKLLAPKLYNRAWIYGLWVVGLFVLGNLAQASRASLFGYEPFQ